MESWKDLEDKLAQAATLLLLVINNIEIKKEKCKEFVANLTEMTEEEYEQAVAKNERKTE